MFKLKVFERGEALHLCGFRETIMLAGAKLGGQNKDRVTHFRCRPRYNLVEVAWWLGSPKLARVTKMRFGTLNRG